MKGNSRTKIGLLQLVLNWTGISRKDSLLQEQQSCYHAQREEMAVAGSQSIATSPTSV